MSLTTGALTQHRVFEELLFRNLVVPRRIMVQIFRSSEQISIIAYKLFDTRISLTSFLHFRFPPKQTQIPRARAHFPFPYTPGMLGPGHATANRAGSAYRAYI